MKFTVRSRDCNAVATDTSLANCVRISIANSIINSHSDIVDLDETGITIAIFVNGLAVWIDSQFYHEIEKELRNIYKK